MHELSKSQIIIITFVAMLAWFYFNKKNRIMFCNHKRVAGVLKTKEMCSCSQSKRKRKEILWKCESLTWIFAVWGWGMIKHSVCRKLPGGDFSIFPESASAGTQLFLVYYKKGLLRGNLSVLSWRWTGQALLCIGLCKRYFSSFPAATNPVLNFPLTIFLTNEQVASWSSCLI